ncbi:MAG: uroporphyrinogen decarboxylase family protein [Planctomycetota bacterium]
MNPLTSKERVAETLRRKPVDHVPAFENFWADTQRHWAEQGHVAPDENLPDHFELDLRLCWPFNMVADLDAEEEIVEETDETILARDGNGALLRRWKTRTGTPEHVDFRVTDRAGWEEHIRPRLVNDADDRRRINFEGYRNTRARCAERDLYFCWGGLNVFELMHPVCGHEHMLFGMAMDPDWVADMCNVYADLIIRLMEILFAKKGRPDGIWFFEDMGFKGRPFMSPEMYRRIVWPAHKRTFDYAHSLGCTVIVHSCGYVAPLVPALIEAGMDCLQAIEVKAGMDLLELKRNFGDRIALCGGMDIRALESNDAATVERELQAKLPGAADGGGYILHTDHSVSSRVEYDIYRYFLQRGRRIGTF